MEKEKKIFLLDAYALIFRSYYAFIRNPRFTSKGLNTSAIFGFTNTLLEILLKEKPTHLAVVFDPPGPTFRNKMYEAYKANREETPEDIRKSIPYIKRIIDALCVKQVEIKGFEADDVIGTLSVKAANENFQVYMMTPDKDYGQLVSDKVFIYKPKKGGNDAEIWGVDEINAKYDITSPCHVIDILGLMGDASDNVPGAPGIGEKTAMKLISQYQTIDNLYNHLDDLKGKQKETLEEHRDQVMLSKKLVTIDLNVPVDFSENEYKVKDFNEEELRSVFEELEFKTILERIIKSPEQTVKKPASLKQSTLFDEDEEYSSMPQKNYHTIDNTPHQYFVMDDDHKHEQLIQILSDQVEFCFDTETTGLEWHKAALVGIAFSVKKGEAYYMPVPEDQENARMLVQKFKSVFENKNIRKIGQNIKYDILILSNYDIHVDGEIFDTLIAHYLLQPELKHNLDYLAQVYLDYKTVSIETLIGPKGKGQLNMRNVPIDKIKEYAGEDADITYQLKEILYKDLKSNNLLPLATEIEMPLTLVLSSIENS